MTRVSTQPGVNREFVLRKAAYFRDVGLWPRTEVLDPQGWLSNFTEEEMPLAIHLLNAFQFFSEDLTDSLFVAAFQGLSTEVSRRGRSAGRAAWSSLVDRAIVTPVEGERPNPTDSGYAFARRARRLLDIPEARILRPAQALGQLISAATPIIFVDDFVGSGNQFIETWARPYGHDVAAQAVSFKSVAQIRGGDFYYCPLICTEYGAERIRATCPEVHLMPAYVISARDGALHAESRLWPRELLPLARQFIESASQRAGIPPAGTSGWQGFHALGLALGFAHSVPDATLPLFYWEAQGWRPLIRRT